MFCSKCGSQNKDDAAFCWSCGAPIQVGEPSAYPPSASSPVSVVVPEVHYAGFWRRFLAWIIDRLILQIPFGIIGLFTIGSAFFSFRNIFTDLPNFEDVDQIIRFVSHMVFVGIWIGLLKTVIRWLYYSFFESSQLQATPGKMAIGIVVTDMDGKRVSFGRATGRHFAKIISGVILGVGYMMAGWTEKKQALHDMMANCLVVKK